MTSASIDLGLLTATEATVMLDAGELGSEELLDAQLERVERFNGDLNAVVALDVDRARDRARRADAATAAGESWGPLHGLPITVKDAFETEGLVTTCGAPQLADHIPASDATAVGLLKDAGAIVFAKTNTPIWAGDVQTYNDVYGLTRNPWGLDRTTGGSSGGAAAALASGMTLLELGSDIGGSIRNPAHYCGVFGHKPTWTAVSERGHIPPPPGCVAQGDLSVAGPLGRSAADLELAMSVLAVDIGGVPGARLPGSRVEALDGCRVGVWTDDPAAPTSAETAAAIRSLADDLSDAGAVVRDDVRPATSFEDAHRLYTELLMAVVGAGFPAPQRARLERAAQATDSDDDSHEAVVARAATQSHRDYLVANEIRHRIVAEWDEVFSEIDVMITPVTMRSAFPHDIEVPFDERVVDVDGESVPYHLNLAWAGLATLPLLPATVLPVARSDEGLPMGAQIIGPRWGDHTTLAVARLIEELRGGFVPPPMVL